jgi:hypothetical protein
MAVFRSIVFASVLSGLLVGSFATIAQHIATVPLIVQAEVYEEQVHNEQHKDKRWQPANGFERNTYTALPSRRWSGVGRAALMPTRGHTCGKDTGYSRWRHAEHPRHLRRGVPTRDHRLGDLAALGVIQLPAASADASFRPGRGKTAKVRSRSSRARTRRHRPSASSSGRQA